MPKREHQRNRAAGGRLENVFGSLLVRRFSVRQPDMYRVVEEAARSGGADKAFLCELAQTAMDLEYEDLEGDFIQTGGDAGVFAVLEHAKRRSRPFVVYDPPYGKTVPMSGGCALAYLDCGEYEPMRLLLERLVPRLVTGGRLIIVRYRTLECRRAVDEYFHGKRGFQLVQKSRLHIIRNS
jgi:hypothetical protein